jgi:hypothetical protein
MTKAAGKDRRKGPVRLDRIAETLLGPLVSKAGFSSTQILAAWPQIVGPDIASRSRPEKIRWPARRDDGDQTQATLIVRAEGVDALEIQYGAEAILERINQMFGWRAVGRISIRQAPVAAPPRPARPGIGEAETGSHADDARLAGVQDRGLRSALARLGARIEPETDTKA